MDSSFVVAVQLRGALGDKPKSSSRTLIIALEFTSLQVNCCASCWALKMKSWGRSIKNGPRSQWSNFRIQVIDRSDLIKAGCASYHVLLSSLTMLIDIWSGVSHMFFNLHSTAYRDCQGQDWKCFFWFASKSFWEKFYVWRQALRCGCRYGHANF